MATFTIYYLAQSISNDQLYNATQAIDFYWSSAELVGNVSATGQTAAPAGTLKVSYSYDPNLNSCTGLVVIIVGPQAAIATVPAAITNRNLGYNSSMAFPFEANSINGPFTSVVTTADAFNNIYVGGNALRIATGQVLTVASGKSYNIFEIQVSAATQNAGTGSQGPQGIQGFTGYTGSQGTGGITGIDSQTGPTGGLLFADASGNMYYNSQFTMNCDGYYHLDITGEGGILLSDSVANNTTAVLPGLLYINTLLTQTYNTITSDNIYFIGPTGTSALSANTLLLTDSTTLVNTSIGATGILTPNITATTITDGSSPTGSTGAYGQVLTSTGEGLSWQTPSITSAYGGTAYFGPGISLSSIPQLFTSAQGPSIPQNTSVLVTANVTINAVGGSVLSYNIGITGPNGQSSFGPTGYYQNYGSPLSSTILPLMDLVSTPAYIGQTETFFGAIQLASSAPASVSSISIMTMVTGNTPTGTVYH